MSDCPFSRFAFALMMFCAYPTSVDANNNAPTFDASIAKTNVESMECIVRNRYSSRIERHIKAFVVLTRKNTQEILGRSTMYFPTIERVLKEEELPDDLKYLTVVESMLDPKAVSYAGARGMWQLMPVIAEEYGLTIDGLVDERSNVEMSTRASARYLKKLYSQFNNWELALAAYNCGASRVRKTLKAANKRTYWGIRPYLPKQTQDFVPKFIAIKYLFTHYQDYQLEPTFPELDMQITRKVIIQRGHSLDDIAAITGVSAGSIALLNPSLKYNTQAYSYTDLEILLPARVAEAYKEYLTTSKSYFIDRYAFDPGSSAYYKVIYTGDRMMSLQEFCDQHNLSYNQVRLWNHLSDDMIQADQEIFIYDYNPLKQEFQVKDNQPMDASIFKSGTSYAAVG